jgi:hypothetical protein
LKCGSGNGNSSSMLHDMWQLLPAHMALLPEHVQKLLLMSLLVPLVHHLLITRTRISTSDTPSTAAAAAAAVPCCSRRAQLQVRGVVLR